ncbi:MAG: asparagine synthase (glutamine-hydrolyzing) [Acidobacteriota bacterium]
MCGIAGFLSLTPHHYPDSILTDMTHSIAHRGPDDTGVYRDAYAALGHRRLSIVDLSGGHQPMTSESGDLWLVFNGEIFNHASIREKELEPRGHVYQTHSDTETILHAYEEFGVDSPTHFRGMFAYVIWDRRQRKLFCVRDRLGIKPFYYFWNGREFIFGSEIKALLQHPSVSAVLEDSLLPEHLAFGYSSGELTLYRGIRRLLPGHTLTIETEGPQAGQLQIRRYWDVPEPGREDTAKSEQDWIEECHQRLEETVRMRLMADVPLGMFLSGGVDSSLIAAFMKRMVSGPVKSFAVGYREAEFSELGYAREVAAALGTQHHEIELGMEDFFNALPKLIWHEDEPITWPSSVSLYFVSKLAAQQVKVVLTGEGSDELFGGYGRYHFYLLNQKFLGAWKLLPAGMRRLVREQVADSPLLSAPIRRKLSHTFVGLGEDMESLYLDNFYSAFPASERAALGQPGNAYGSYQHYWQAASGRSTLDQLLYADQKTYLAELLMKQDQMSMATSIESRVPFLDHTFVEFASRVPQNLKLRGSTGKYLIKKVAEQLIPRSAIYRKKMGFPTPLRVWLQDARMQPALDAMISRDGFLASVVDVKAVETLLQRHRSGQLDATDRLWRLLNLHLWGEMQIAGRRTPDDALMGVAAAV